eukprot:GHVR01162901.1.p1 GENE.GHVR01162901.1~~GHVR01162901.1.p1  ORF type:complete len:284 (-),score=60.51 GHVR01162901.1:173-922(-)
MLITENISVNSKWGRHNSKITEKKVYVNDIYWDMSVVHTLVTTSAARTMINDQQINDIKLSLPCDGKLVEIIIESIIGRKVPDDSSFWTHTQSQQCINYLNQLKYRLNPFDVVYIRANKNYDYKTVKTYKGNGLEELFVIPELLVKGGEGNPWNVRISDADGANKRSLYYGATVIGTNLASSYYAEYNNSDNIASYEIISKAVINGQTQDKTIKKLFPFLYFTKNKKKHSSLMAKFIKIKFNISFPVII